jgi:ribosomal protein L11 methyltransferase
MSETSASTVARLTTDAATARRIDEALAEALTDAVATSAFEEADGRWSLALHFRAPPDEAAVRALIAAAGGDAAAATFETLPPADWVRRGLDRLTPVEAGRFVVHGAHDRARVRPNKIAIEIEASLAFGTGHHGTTRGCLLALDRIVKQWSVSRPRARNARRILDLGTGSGVLAIAAARALHVRVLASDIDPRAVAIARANVRHNRAAAHVEVIRAASLASPRFARRGPYALILANILLEPLQQLATPLARLAAPDGYVVLSGLLVGQATAALASYRARGLVLIGRIRLEGWMTLVLRRR